MKIKKIKKGSLIILAVTAAASCYLFLAGDYSVLRYVDNKNRYENAVRETEEVKRKIETQREMNEKLKNKDPFEMEKKARESGMVKEGETVYIYEIEKEK